MINTLFSVLESSHSETDQCAWYVTSILIDVTLGVWVAFRLLALAMWLRRRGKERTDKAQYVSSRDVREIGGFQTSQGTEGGCLCLREYVSGWYFVKREGKYRLDGWGWAVQTIDWCIIVFLVSFGK